MSSVRTVFAVLLACGVAILSGCGSGGGDSRANVTTTTTTTTTTGPAGVAEINLLFIGNSHTAVNDVPGTVASMMRASNPQRSIAVAIAPNSAHLQDHSTDPSTLALLQSRRWSAVILQAQNYSLSGQTVYPSSGAESLVRMARQQGAVPILFPEWPRRGINETQLIFATYVAIAKAEPACVPPIPQAFDLAASRYPTITLLDADGNHSAPAGAFLGAVMIFTTITGLSAATLPTLTQAGVDGATQRQLNEVAAESANAISTRAWCPADPFIR